MWGKTQYSKEEVIESRRISRGRVNVERSIGFLKTYKIMKETVSVKILPYMSKIAYVCAALINLQSVNIRDLQKDFSQNYNKFREQSENISK